MQTHPLEHLPMILVSGQARSGTTILTRAIGAHPQVFSNQRESTYIRDVLQLFHSNLNSPARIRQMLADGHHFADCFRTALYHVLFPIDHLPSNVPDAVSTFSSLTPEGADQLKTLFPRLFILNMVRNGIEVVDSRMRHLHIGQLPFEAHCRAWAAARGMVEWGSDHDGFMVVRHENIRDEKKVVGVFAEVCDRLNLEPTDQCANYAVQERVSQSTADHGSLDDRARRWNDWTSTQQAVFREICGPVMDFFGYAVPSENP